MAAGCIARNGRRNEKKKKDEKINDGDAQEKEERERKRERERKGAIRAKCHSLCALLIFFWLP